ncbi:hypothetical protein GCM10007421_25990 [Halopseudomonas oceani]|uniref:Uncharacterized protein n=1 Tax=Halopseudomonas oceani TaxID=1708783 RepID=A0A2P4EU93_9GAMM|nr:hypothetical protein [Halopseudomonas oceani]POB03005.1 hypothetical protein C1949_11605 [Halopseudomonas oceani]GGE50480.1 hypothetical protein GCM10007421_25990 [Halopseudomonas oceani]
MSKSQTTQAYFTAGMSTLLTSIGLYFCKGDVDLMKMVVPAGAVVAPFLTLFLVKVFAFLNVDTNLIKYKAALASDLRKQRKILKDPLIDEVTKEEVRKAYAQTSLLLSSASQDVLNGVITIKSPEDKITG